MSRLWNNPGLFSHLLDMDDEGFGECLQRAVTENILLQLETKKKN